MAASVCNVKHPVIRGSPHPCNRHAVLPHNTLAPPTLQAGRGPPPWPLSPWCRGEGMEMGMDGDARLVQPSSWTSTARTRPCHPATPAPLGHSSSEKRNTHSLQTVLYDPGQRNRGWFPNYASAGRKPGSGPFRASVQRRCGPGVLFGARPENRRALPGGPARVRNSPGSQTNARERGLERGLFLPPFQGAGASRSGAHPFPGAHGAGGGPIRSRKCLARLCRVTRPAPGPTASASGN